MVEEGCRVAAEPLASPVLIPTHGEELLAQVRTGANRGFT